MDKISQRAGEVFESGYYCAESVLLAVAESRGIESELIPRIATDSAAVCQEPVARAEP